MVPAFLRGHPSHAKVRLFFLQCRAKKVPSVLKALSIGPAPEINPTDQAYQRLQKNMP